MPLPVIRVASHRTYGDEHRMASVTHTYTHIYRQTDITAAKLPREYILVI